MGIARRSECMTSALLSMTTAFSARTRTTARRSGTTHHGSYVALSTSAAPNAAPYGSGDSQPDDAPNRTSLAVVSPTTAPASRLATLPRGSGRVRPLTGPDSFALVALPQFWEDHKKVLIEIPIRVVAIILVALLIRAILRRMIDRAVRPVRGEVPRILRPFKEKLENSSFLESAGLLSERRAQRAATLGSVLKSAVSITIFGIAFLLILGELQINLAPFIAGTSIVGVALGFGAQNIVKDFLAGIFMLLEDQYGVGDVIDFQLASGTVEAVGLRSTRLRDVNGTVWYVRNGEVLRVG